MPTRGRVLIVDDDLDLQRLLAKTLQVEHDVAVAGSGAEALAALAAAPFDVVILDVMMPGTSGLEVCREIRARFPQLLPGVLLLTALDDQENRRRGLEAGADDYLAKPIDRRELSLRVRHFVRLAQQERVIRAQLQALKELVALKDDLTALIVHDLRNPLTGVQTALQLLERDASLDDATRETARLGRASAEQVMDATKDLLQIRMLESDRLPLSLAPTSMGGVVRAAAEAVRLVADASDVEVRVAIDGDVRLALDEKLLRRALENLLANAIRHTRGPIDVALSTAAGRAVVSVADRGQGVPDALKEGLFEKFGSLQLQKAGARRGHGLGLYLVRLVAQAHGGEVDVDDREGGGASFRLVLPVAGPGP